jgi:large subunit ribosomal protein L25
MSVSQVSFSLRAETRSETGKGIARKARQSGKIPAIVYRGGHMPANVYLDQTEVLSGLRKNVSRNVLIGIEGIRAEQVTCLVREVQRHPVSQNIEHIDLYEVAVGDSTVVEVPFVTTGKSMGVKAGGLLRQLVRSVTLKCSPLAIPANVEYDITSVDIGAHWH